jgi:hypothetical protein
VTIAAVGTCSITASQAGNATYAAAPSVTQTFTVTKATSIVTWETPKAITYGLALSAQQLDATSKIPGTFEYSPAKGTVLGVGSHTLSVTFTPTNTADYAAQTSTVKLEVKPALLTITANNIKVEYGKALPAFGFTPAGFVHGDTRGALTGKPDETTAAKLDSRPGTYKITIKQGTLKAANYTFQFKDGTLTITSLGTASAPTFAPKAGTSSTTQTVTLVDKTPGAVIHFTTNGTTPTPESPKYTKPITVKATTIFKAIAVAPGYSNSPVATAKYTIN